MLESLLIKDAQLVLPNGIHQGDVLIKNGKIARIDSHIPLDTPAEQVITDRGLTVIPGVIDPHVHFRDPGHPHKETLASGSQAAAAGGVTSFFDMPNTSPSTTTLEALITKKLKAAKTSLVNYNFYIGATSENLEDLQQAENVPGIKIYVGSSTGNLLVDGQKALDEIFAKTTKLIAVHSEDETMVRENMEKYKGETDVITHTKIRNPEAALKCTKRLFELSKHHNHHLHICHLTTKEEAAFLTQHKKEAPITTEVSPQHLLLNDSLYESLGTKLQINPPIRSRDHQQALWQTLKSGIIDLIATDHAPHTLDEKAKPYPTAPSGMPGIQTSLTLMLDQVNRGLCSLEDIVRWMCAKPAEIFSIQNKGQLIEGYDADIAILDLSAKRTIRNQDMLSNAKWTCFDGWETTGWPVATVVNGQIVFREGDIFNEVKGKEIQIK